MYLENCGSFESLVFNSKKPLSTTIALIYHPPKPHPTFISDIHNFLISLCTIYSNILIVGDFNIHMHSLTCRVASDFKHVLDCLNLHQLVDASTHIKGHTLDLIITDSVAVLGLLVYDVGFSDHLALNLKVPITSPLTKPKRHITFKDIKNIDSSSLHQHLQLLHPPPHSSTADLMDYYNRSLSLILDIHAPLKTRTVTFTRSAPWFTTELRKMKRSGYVLERACKTFDLTVHKLAYREHRKSYAKALSRARSAHYSTLKNNPGN